MELQGELSDFPLADILQIICLSKKTGTLVITGSERKGMVVFVRGRIVQAVTDQSPTSLGDLLVARQLIGPFELEQALGLQQRTTPYRLLGSLLVELGYVERLALTQRVREEVQKAIAGLLALKRGSFELKLNVVPIGRERHYPGQDIVLTEGCEVEELLLEAATAEDEAGWDGRDPSGPHARVGTGRLLELAALDALADPDVLDGFAAALDRNVDEDPERLLAMLDPGGALRRETSPAARPASDRDRFLRLQAFLLELKQLGSHAEVALTILRFGAEMASRGVLFLVTDSLLTGQGQFGVQTPAGTGPSLADRRVREIRISRDEPSMLADAARSGATRLGRPDRSAAMSLVLEKIGGGADELIAAAVPMVCNGRVRIVLYIDNHPGNCELRGLQELEVLVGQAGLVMERILLEQRLNEIELNRPPSNSAI
jgi:hypothetical protein